MTRLGFSGARFLAAFCLLSRLGECSTDQSSSSADYSNCEEQLSSVADGVCDVALNTAACGFDGGDCCECTCFVGDVLCDKTEPEYSCEDPDAPTDCGLTASSTTSSTSAVEQSECEGYVPHIQDGFCDAANNNAACGFDGGDCCACTCGEDLEHPCGVEGDGFDCQDPDVPSNCSLSLGGCDGYTYNLQNSYCNSDLNNAECGYDGGDCCRCTCREYSSYDVCGYYGYDCIDPNAPLDCESDSPTPSPTVSGYPGCAGPGYSIQNGYCNSDLNNEECGYDGGDCCECTCEDGAYYSCGYYGYDCIDPSAPSECELETDIPTPSPTIYGYPGCGGSAYEFRNSYCNSDLNNEECGYDGGDCCECTCEDDGYSTCGYYGYACIDPSAPRECDLETDSLTSNPSEGDHDECHAQVSYISDGLCNTVTNTEACGWDGGDCCECTCTDNTYVCGAVGYNCLDPVGADGCPQPTAAPAHEQAGFEDTPVPDTSYTTAEVGGVVTIAVAGFVGVGVAIVGGLVYARQQCQACVS